MRSASALIPCFIILSSSSSSAFLPNPIVSKTSARRPSFVTREHELVLDAVQTFSGSEVVSPVVASGVFWASLKSNILILLLGQLVAAVAFVIVGTIASKQLAEAIEKVAERIFSGGNNDYVSKKLRIPPSGRSSYAVEPDLAKLLVCLAVDMVGMSSEIVPVLGEVTDFAWAPIAALILRSLYGSNVLFVLELTEEILPFTDFLPLATIVWIVDTFYPKSPLAGVMQVGQFSTRINGSDRLNIIDVESKTDLQDQVGKQLRSSRRDEDHDRR